MKGIQYSQAEFVEQTLIGILTVGKRQAPAIDMAGSESYSVIEKKQ